MSGVDRNDLAYWFPRVKAAGLPVPDTRIVTTDIDLCALTDGVTPAGFDQFVNELMWAGNEIGGRPFFLRTGHGSGKHNWSRTCFVDEGNLGWHVAALVEWSHTVDMFGLPHQTWAVRKLIDTAPLFLCQTWEGFPVTREFRVFVRGGLVETHYPYWPEDAIESARPDRDDWRQLLRSASTLDDAQVLKLAERAGTAVDDGYWSIDFLQDRAGAWWLTDMADGAQSYRPVPRAGDES